MSDNTASSPKLRMVRVFGQGITPSESCAYRVETVELMTEKQAMAVMRDLGSPYAGMKYDDAPFRQREAGASPA